jgi:hypothetical protein
MRIIPGLSRLRQEDCKFDISLGYKLRPCLKNKSTMHNVTTTKEREYGRGIRKGRQMFLSSERKDY